MERIHKETGSTAKKFKTNLDGLQVERALTRERERKRERERERERGNKVYNKELQEHFRWATG